jgi:hypothetical protein
MSIQCTRCAGTGFLNIEQVPAHVQDHGTDQILIWIKNASPMHDVQVCDCCGDGEYWHGEAGVHYTAQDPRGKYGPYAYNGGLCECH